LCRRPCGRARRVRQPHGDALAAATPRGLTHVELDLETRILTVCDVYDALASPRVYRPPAWPAHLAFALLAEESELAFDLRYVAALARVLDHDHALRLAS
jgi:HD-GYP domain-containing protein (c-di-GMP phosphodiesterase class II)